MFRRACLGILLALLAFASPASSQGRPPAPPGYSAQPFASPASPQGRPPGYSVQPLDRILPGVRNGRPGRFFDAQGPYPDQLGGWHYRIKWLTPDGRVMWLDTDARTGRVIGPSSGYRPGFMMPPSGLRYYRYPRPMPGARSPFGGWRPAGRGPGGREPGGRGPGGRGPGGRGPGGGGPGGMGFGGRHR